MATASFKKQEHTIQDTKVGVTFRPACTNKPYKVDFTYIDHEGMRQRKPRSFATIDECWAHAERTLAAAHQKIDLRKAGKLTVAGLGREFIDSYHKLAGSGPSTIHNIELAFRRINAHIGNVTLADLTQWDVNKVRDAFMAENLKIDTVRGYLGPLRWALKWAIEEGYIDQNVALRSRMPGLTKVQKKAKRVRMWIPSEQDMANILDLQATLPGVEDKLLHETLSEFLAHTGCRISEALKLHRDDINRDGKTVRVGGKTSGSYRTLPMDAELQAMVDRLKERWLLSGGMIFCNTKGVVPDGDTFRRRMVKVATALNLPDVHPHLFRHYCASRMLAAGMSLHKVKEQLGHSNIGITSDIYGHLEHGDSADEISEVSNRLRALRSSIAPALRTVALLPMKEPSL